MYNRMYGCKGRSKRSGVNPNPPTVTPAPSTTSRDSRRVPLASPRLAPSQVAGMGLYQLVEAFLLLTNAVAILNEDRFLAPMGLGITDMSTGRMSPFKGQMVGFIHAVQYLRVPLVVANSVVIVSKLLFG